MSRSFSGGFLLRGLDYTPVGTVLYTQRRGLLGATQAFADIVGYPLAATFGKHMEDFTHPDDWAASRWLLANAIKAGIPFTLNKRYVRQSGEVVWVENHYTILTTEDLVDPLVCLLSRRLDALPLAEPAPELPPGDDYSDYVQDMCLQLAGMATASSRMISSDLLRLAAKVIPEKDTPV